MENNFRQCGRGHGRQGFEFFQNVQCLWILRLRNRSEVAKFSSQDRILHRAVGQVIAQCTALLQCFCGQLGSHLCTTVWSDRRDERAPGTSSATVWRSRGSQMPVETTLACPTAESKRPSDSGCRGWWVGRYARIAMTRSPCSATGRCPSGTVAEALLCNQQSLPTGRTRCCTRKLGRKRQARLMPSDGRSPSHHTRLFLSVRARSISQIPQQFCPCPHSGSSTRCTTVISSDTGPT